MSFPCLFLISYYNSIISYLLIQTEVLNECDNKKEFIVFIYRMKTKVMDS